MSSGSFSVRRLSIAEILDEGFRMFRHTFWRLLVFQLIVYVPTTALLAYGIYWGGEYLTALLDVTDMPDPVSLALNVTGFIFGLLALQVSIGAVVLVATSRAVADTYLGRDWTGATIIAQAVSMAPRAIGVGAFVFGSLLVAVLVPLSIGGAIGVGLTVVIGASPLAFVFAVLFAGAFGLFALLTSFFVVLRFGLALIALAVERTGFTKSLARSAELMRGRYPRGLALFLILVAVNLLISSLLAVFTPSPGFEGVDPDELRRLIPLIIRGQVVSSIVGQAAGIFVQIYASICWTLFYFTARCEAEAFDLSHLASNLAESSQ